MIRNILRKFDSETNRETVVLLTYLIPFTFNPIYFVNALVRLDKRLVPKLSQELSGKIRKYLEEGLDPLTALQRVSSEIRDNVVSRLIQNYVYVARHVGSATLLSISFLEEALESIRGQWKRYIDYMNLVTEVTVVLFMSSIIGVVLSLFNYQNTGYLSLIPITLVFTLIGSSIGYIYMHPWMGNFYQEFQVNKEITALLYMVTLVVLSGILAWPQLTLYFAASSIAVGFIVEYKSVNLEKRFKKFIDEISSIMNNLEIGFPGTPEITGLVAKHGLYGRIGTLLTALSEGVTVAGETGLRGSFNRIVNIVQASYKSFRKYRGTIYTYITIILATLLVTLYTAHTLTGIGGKTLNGQQLNLQRSVVEEINTLIQVASFIVPIALGVSYRPRLPPLLYSGLSLLAANIVTVLFQ
ncbi:MAG: hypothetical protein LRS45_02400 [Desulfurococcales archaeon]|nr:hypothetical protein [Desulfurococcales archaeon]